MKNLIVKFLNRLNSIPKDKYQHFSVGALLAAVMLLLPLCLGVWPWLAMIVSVLAVLTAAVVKERKIDPQADLNDILATLAGGAVVWVIYLFV